VVPDSCEAILRSRLGRNYRQPPDRARSREKPSPADIVCFKRYSLSGFHVSGETRFLAREYMPKGYSRSINRLFESFSGVTDGHPRGEGVITGDLGFKDRNIRAQP
jgi:hypothetical protein